MSRLGGRFAAILLCNMRGLKPKVFDIADVLLGRP
jgi:hypothetical protein